MGTKVHLFCNAPCASAWTVLQLRQCMHYDWAHWTSQLQPLHCSAILLKLL